jgi:LmbE family N-acetylglucosaminyl deacetylase
MYTITRGGASGDPIQRTQELIQSSKFIGAKALWIDDFEDTHLSVNGDLISNIESFVNRSGADLVLTHSLNDTHHDHRAVASANSEAGRFVPNIISYEIPLTRDFKPQASLYRYSNLNETKFISMQMQLKDLLLTVLYRVGSIRRLEIHTFRHLKP